MANRPSLPNSKSHRLLLPTSAYPWALAALALVLFVPLLGSTHLFDWDEINFAESAREMLLTRQYSIVQIGYAPFWEKPPLFFWLQTLAMHCFGVGEFAARLPNALCGVATLLTLYAAGKHWYKPQFGWWWAWCYVGSFLPHLYFKSGIIDPIFNYFIFCSLLAALRAIELAAAQQAQRIWLRWCVWSGLAAGLAVLTKGPVALLLLGLTGIAFGGWQIWAGAYSAASFPTWRTLLFVAILWCVPFIAISSVWVAAEVVQHGWSVLAQFVQYQIRLLTTADAGHQQAFYYHWVVVALGCFPMSALALPTISGWQNYTPADQLRRQAMLCLLWVVLVVFSIVKTKIVHYSSLSYLPLSFLAAMYISRLADSKTLFFASVRRLLAVLGGIFTLLLVAVPLAFYGRQHLIPYINDPFAVGNLQMPVAWSGYEWLWGAAYGAAIVVALARTERQPQLGIYTLLVATATCIWGFTATVVPRIEQHTQGAAIAFYQQQVGKNTYVEPIGFKSYAHLFYAQLPPHHRPPQYSDQWLLSGNIDRPAYLVTKINKTKFVEPYADVCLLYEAGGFAFFERLP